ncbi:MAG: hypothetical protein DMF77_11380 [Acidobacteria bacterium]|nr:MAG: hypothetical protein DMF77_11380 [Acidobacteriota bacterium]
MSLLVATSVGGCYHKSQSTTGPDTPPAAVNGSPVASPTPIPTPAAIGCGLPPGGGSGAGCPYQVGVFTEDVNRAIAEAQNEHPELFDFNDGYGQLSWRVLNRKKYYDVVKYNLERMGYCAAHDEEEIGVKNDNRFNEQFQIMSSFGYSRWGAGSYRATCWPPWF